MLVVSCHVGFFQYFYWSKIFRPYFCFYLSKIFRPYFYFYLSKLFRPYFYFKYKLRSYFLLLLKYKISVLCWTLGAWFIINALHKQVVGALDVSIRLTKKETKTTKLSNQNTLKFWVLCDRPTTALFSTVELKCPGYEFERRLSIEPLFSHNK